MLESVFASRLLSVLKDNAQARRTGNQKRGQLDPKSLHQYYTSGRVFRARVAENARRYSISVLVDTSGSMAGTRSDVVKAVTPKLLMALARAGVDLEVAYFNRAYIPATLFGEALGRDYQAEFARQWDKAYESTAHTVEVEPKPGSMVRRLFHPSGTLPKSQKHGVEHNSDGTFLGFAMWQALERLRGRAGRNLLLVITDGAPNGMTDSAWHSNPEKSYDDYSVKFEVARARRMGVCTLALGIRTRAVEDHFPKSQCSTVEDLSQTFEAMVKLLDRNVKRG